MSLMWYSCDNVSCDNVSNVCRTVLLLFAKFYCVFIYACTINKHDFIRLLKRMVLWMNKNVYAFTIFKM